MKPPKLTPQQKMRVEQEATWLLSRMIGGTPPRSKVLALASWLAPSYRVSLNKVKAP